MIRLLNAAPLTEREKHEIALQPNGGSAARPCNWSQELNKHATGRLNGGVTQVPVARQTVRDGKGDQLLAFRASLPVNEYRDQILAGIANHRVFVISGET